MRYLLMLMLALPMMTTVTSPASSQQYFKNRCAWDASSHCAAKRAEAVKKRQPMPKATVTHHGQETVFAPLRP
jgi:hypothetical protein